MRVHYLRHVAYEGLGNIEPWLHDTGHQVSETRVWTGQPYPSLQDFDWLIVLGGPMGVCGGPSTPWMGAELRFLESAVAAGKQVLGICLGAQMIASVLGASVRRHTHAEIGWHALEATAAGADCEIGVFLRPHEQVMQWHYNTFDLPAGAVHLCRSAACDNQAFAWGANVLALQFHPEIDYPEAESILERDGVQGEGEYTQAEELILKPARFEQLRCATAVFLDRYVTGRLAPGE